MLRPMLREWLDANMPRIVEKAMANPTEPKA
jgi:cell pole-organizing protein PopZ